MSTVDWIGFTGVMLLLAAYFLSAFNVIKNTSLIYILLNGIGGAIACTAAVILRYIPFIILEGAWCVIAVVTLWKRKSEAINIKRI